MQNGDDMNDQAVPGISDATRYMLRYLAESRNDAALREEGERVERPDRQDVKRVSCSFSSRITNAANSTTGYPRFVTLPRTLEVDGFPFGAPVKITITIETEKRGEERTAALNEDGPTTKGDAPATVDADLLNELRIRMCHECWLKCRPLLQVAHAESLASTQETVLVERLKERIKVWRANVETTHSQHPDYIERSEILDELEEVLRTATHPEKTKDEN